MWHYFEQLDEYEKEDSYLFLMLKHFALCSPEVGTLDP